MSYLPTDNLEYLEWILEFGLQGVKKQYERNRRQP